jgi:hypothetical protein
LPVFVVVHSATLLVTPSMSHNLPSFMQVSLMTPRHLFCYFDIDLSAIPDMSCS